MINWEAVRQLPLINHNHQTDYQPDESEVWSPIPGYHFSYEVSSYGRVRSLTRRINVERDGKRFSYERPGSFLKPSMHSGGAVIVTLHQNGRYNTKTLRRLVALAFVQCERNPDQMIVGHRDRNPWNCRADNLIWLTDYRVR